MTSDLNFAGQNTLPSIKIGKASFLEVSKLSVDSVIERHFELSTLNLRDNWK